MSKRSRERQLAKLAARRAADRHKKQRRRSVVVALALIVALAGSGIAFLALTAKEPSNRATPSPKPGEQTGTVQPKRAPRKVACGSEAPKGAGRPKPQFAGPPPMTIDTTKTYTATLHTSCGDIAIELLANDAPQTVNSFVFLARHGYFDGQYFHRLDTGIDVIQGGDPTGEGSGGPGYSIPDEVSGREAYGAGTLAMAKAQAPNSGGSQFFIITGPGGHQLDAQPNYTVFGKVIKGLDVAREIQQLPVEDPNAGLAGQRPTEAIYIDEVTIREK